jgi:hypothetical protein
VDGVSEWLPEVDVGEEKLFVVNGVGGEGVRGYGWCGGFGVIYANYTQINSKVEILTRKRRKFLRLND